MGEPDNSHIPAPADADRLMRLEEHAGFTERAVDELSQEIRILNQRIHDLLKRLDNLEGKLGGVAERVEKVEERAQDEP